MSIDYNVSICNVIVGSSGVNNSLVGESYIIAEIKPLASREISGNIGIDTFLESRSNFEVVSKHECVFDVVKSLIISGIVEEERPNEGTTIFVDLVHLTVNISAEF